jgi:hypothetical protein
VQIGAKTHHKNPPPMVRTHWGFGMVFDFVYLNNSNAAIPPVIIVVINARLFTEN